MNNNFISARQAFGICNNEETLVTLVNLRGRWEEEKDYEDFNDYVEVMRNLRFIKLTNCPVIGGTKRPFGVKLQCGDGVLHMFVKTVGNTYQLAAKII